MVTGKNKRSIEDHFDRALELEEVLEAKGDTEHRLSQVRDPADLATVHYVRQGEPRGSVTRCSAPRSTSATTRSPCCSATTSSTRATRCSSA